MSSFRLYLRRIAAGHCRIAVIPDFWHVAIGPDEPHALRVYVDLKRVFRYGEIARLCIAELAAGERTTRELAAALMAAKGLDTRDRALAKTICLSVIQSMRSCERRHKVRCVGKRRTVCVWAVPRS